MKTVKGNFKKKEIKLLVYSVFGRFLIKMRNMLRVYYGHTIIMISLLYVFHILQHMYMICFQLVHKNIFKFFSADIVRCNFLITRFAL